MTMPRLELRSERHAASRLQTTVIFEMLGYALNGLIFVLLGMQLPAIFASAPEAARAMGLPHWWQPFALVVGVFVGLVALRVLWTWVSLRLTLLKRGRRLALPLGRAVMTFSVAGVRGAVTLAAMLTLPLLGPNGAPFPGRGLALFLGCGVIVLSLLVASIALPLWLRGLALPSGASLALHAEEQRARHALMTVAMDHVEAERAQATAGETKYEAATRVIESYRWRKSTIDDEDESTREARELGAAVRALKLAALRAERAALIAMRARREIDEEIYEQILTPALGLLDRESCNLRSGLIS